MRSDRLNVNSNSYENTNVKLLEINATFSDFTDGGGAVGTFATGSTMPVGSVVLYSFIDVTGAFSGDTSCALQIGDGSDADRFNASSDPSILAAGNIDGGVPQGVQFCSAATSITLTATGGSDWGAVSTDGAMKVYLVYVDPTVSVSI
tara:strand:- start:55 stop:498 length:444 start_codon:yes stop_codon:yes gene_type:complete